MQFAWPPSRLRRSRRTGLVGRLGVMPLAQARTSETVARLVDTAARRQITAALAIACLEHATAIRLV